MFIAVWCVIYPGMGIAVAELLPARSKRDCVPIAVVITGFVATLTFWATNSLRMTATLDAINALFAATSTWVVAQHSRNAARYLVPWAAWMPITLSLKLYAILMGS
jgi:hypothetical protein